MTRPTTKEVADRWQRRRFGFVYYPPGSITEIYVIWRRHARSTARDLGRLVVRVREAMRRLA